MELNNQSPERHVFRRFAFVTATLMGGLSISVACGDSDPDKSIQAAPVEEVVNASIPNLNQGADGFEPAVKIPNNTIYVQNAEEVPQDLIDEISDDVVSVISKQACTGQMQQGPEGNNIGVVTAAHCVNDVKATVWTGEGFQEGPSVESTSIIRDPITDIAYIGLYGNDAKTVQQQFEAKAAQIDLYKIPINTPAIMIGYPGYGNPNGEKKLLLLSTGEMTRWPQGTRDFLATFGNWTNKVTCGDKSSGSMLFVRNTAGLYVPVGVLMTRAEFSPVLSMPWPWTAEDGEEWQVYFEVKTELELDNIMFMCGFEGPSNN